MKLPLCIVKLSFSATQSASKQLDSDNKLANTLFGIVALFFCGHILRMILSINQFFIMENHANVAVTHPVGNGECIVATSTWIQVCTSMHNILP